MPDITPVALADVALAASAANALSVSRGPGAVPLYDPNITWDPVAKQHILKGQALGSGGDRHQWQDNAGFSFARIDSAGRIVRDHSNDGLSQYALMVIPGTHNPPAAIATQSTINDDGVS